MSAPPLAAVLMRPASGADRERAAAAHRAGTLVVDWPPRKALRAWARDHDWPAPRIHFDGAFFRKLFESDETFALGLADSGLGLRLPVERHRVSLEDLLDFDAAYESLGGNGRPDRWGELVARLRGLRRAIEAGIEVEVGNHVFHHVGSFLIWAHARYGALEEGYDSWIGDDES